MHYNRIFLLIFVWTPSARLRSCWSLQRVLNDFKRTRLSHPEVWFGSSPTPSIYIYQQNVSLSQSSCMSPVEPTDGRGGGTGAKSYDGEKAWSSANNSMLSGTRHTCCAYWVIYGHWVMYFVAIATLLKSVKSVCALKKSLARIIYLFSI